MRTLTTSIRFAPGVRALCWYCSCSSPYRSHMRLMNVGCWFQNTAPWSTVGTYSTVGGLVTACQIS